MLLYTADLKLPRCMPYKDKVRKVSLIITQLALTTCQHVRIGSSVQRGISGERPILSALRKGRRLQGACCLCRHSWDGYPTEACTTCSGTANPC